MHMRACTCTHGVVWGHLSKCMCKPMIYGSVFPRAITDRIFHWVCRSSTNLHLLLNELQEPACFHHVPSQHQGLSSERLFKGKCNTYDLFTQRGDPQQINVLPKSSLVNWGVVLSLLAGVWVRDYFYGERQLKLAASLKSSVQQPKWWLMQSSSSHNKL